MGVPIIWRLTVAATALSAAASACSTHPSAHASVSVRRGCCCMHGGRARCQHVPGAARRKERGFVPIVKYGEEFEAGRTGKTPRSPVKLLYSGGNHYDLLLPGVL